MVRGVGVGGGVVAGRAVRGGGPSKRGAGGAGGLGGDEV